MVGWHHQLNEYGFEQTQGGGEGQGSLACCSPWGHKESDRTERHNSNKAVAVCQGSLGILIHRSKGHSPNSAPQEDPSGGTFVGQVRADVFMEHNRSVAIAEDPPSPAADPPPS